MTIELDKKRCNGLDYMNAQCPNDPEYHLKNGEEEQDLCGPCFKNELFNLVTDNQATHFHQVVENSFELQ